jgi:hypothetical protein
LNAVAVQVAVAFEHEAILPVVINTVADVTHTQVHQAGFEQCLVLPVSGVGVIDVGIYADAVHETVGRLCLVVRAWLEGRGQRLRAGGAGNQDQARGEIPQGVCDVASPFLLIVQNIRLKMARVKGSQGSSFVC